MSSALITNFQFEASSRLSPSNSHWTSLKSHWTSSNPLLSSRKLPSLLARRFLVQQQLICWLKTQSAPKCLLDSHFGLISLTFRSVFTVAGSLFRVDFTYLKSTRAKLGHARSRAAMRGPKWSCAASEWLAWHTKRLLTRSPCLLTT